MKAVAVFTCRYRRPRVHRAFMALALRAWRISPCLSCWFLNHGHELEFRSGGRLVSRKPLFRAAYESGRVVVTGGLS